MAEIRWHNNPVVFSPTEPSPSMVTELSLWPTTDWKWLNTTNGRWYDRVGGEWVMQGEAPVVGVDLDFTGAIKKITRLKIENGIITAFEYEE